MRVAPTLRAAESCDDVARWSVKHRAESWLKLHHNTLNYYCYQPSENGWNNSNGGVLDMSVPTSPVDSGTPSRPDDYSTTNVQERGVDEADIIKTDGHHIYVVRGNSIAILKGWPVEEAEEIAVIPASAVDAQFRVSLKLMLSGSRLIVSADAPRNELQVYDITDPASPVLAQRLVLPGRATHMRMIKGRVHFVMKTVWEPASLGLDDAFQERALPQSPYSPEAENLVRTEQSRHRIYEDLDEIAAEIAVQRRLPVASLERPGQPRRDVMLYDGCEGNILLNDALPRDTLLTSIISVNVEDMSDLKATGAFTPAELFYTSTNNLYIAASGLIPYHAAPQGQADTHLYAFDLSRDDAATYSGHGVVAGEILPDLAMSEHAGHLRVFANAAGETQLTIFKAVDGALERVGQLTGIAPGERATAARMSGDRLYVLTAKGSGITSPELPPEHPDFIDPNDPLFVIDAADPTAPKLLGELDFPGFSAYVHLMGRDHLLSLGRDERLRLRLQVFDVTDTSAPKILHEHTVSRDGHIHQSEAQGDRLRFVYHAARGLLALPVVEQSLETRMTTFHGHMLFDVSTGGISSIGQVHHGALSDSACDGSRCDAPSISASLFMEDYLYSFSDQGFMIHDAGERPVIDVVGASYSR